MSSSRKLKYYNSYLELSHAYQIDTQKDIQPIYLTNLGVKTDDRGVKK